MGAPFTKAHFGIQANQALGLLFSGQLLVRVKVVTRVVCDQFQIGRGRRAPDA